MNSTKESKTVKVKILDKEVQIGCAPGDEDDLSKAAKFVDVAMREFRNRSTTSTTEKIAIITAINTANEYLRLKEAGEDAAAMAKKMEAMQSEIEAVLAES